MTRQIIITADDFGLSRGINDTILETVDRGAVTRVSILANGYDVDHALEEWSKRSGTLSLSVHLNLTEGKPLCQSAQIPHLVDRRGAFRYSSGSLLFAVYCSPPQKRRALLQEIERELSAQVELIRSRIGSAPLSVDGHQHVHLIPAVFDILCALSHRHRFASVRLCREPFFVDLASPGTTLRRFHEQFAINLLARANRGKAERVGIPQPDLFVGKLFSGRLTLSSIYAALATPAAHAAASVEIGAHPGSASLGEVDGWKGDSAWHYSPWRARERSMLQDPQFLRRDLLALRAERAGRVVRFLIAGSLATGTDLVLLYALTAGVGLWYLSSTVLAWFAAFAVSFALQKRWTFGDKSERAFGSLGKYLTLQGTNAALNALGVFALVEYAQLNYVLAQMIVAAAIAAWTYLISRRFIFSMRHPV